MTFDWTDLIYIPQTRAGWMLVVAFVLPLVGALLLAWATLGGFGA